MKLRITENIIRIGENNMDYKEFDAKEFRKICGYDNLVRKLDSISIQTRILNKCLQKKAQDYVSEIAQEIGQVYIRDYPYHPRKRESFSNSKIKTIIEDAVSKSAHLGEIIDNTKKYKDNLAKIPPHEAAHGEPYWLNTYLGLMDSVMVYSILAQKNPRWYVEVGSGNTTKFARRAIRDNKLRTEIISIDPHPRAEIDALCNKIYRVPLEEMDLNFFSLLTEEDILLLDNSHRAFANSDVTVFFTEILPNLPKGLLYTLHDIALPDEYFVERFYNEQYMLATYLLGGAAGDEIYFPTAYLINYTSKLDELQKALGLEHLPLGGGFFWMRKN